MNFPVLGMAGFKADSFGGSGSSYSPEIRTLGPGGSGMFFESKCGSDLPFTQANPGKRSEVIPEIGTRSLQNVI